MSGINKLANVIQQRCKDISKSPDVFDFGVIQKDGSLQLSKFPLPIPKGDYLACKNADIKINESVLAAWVGNDLCVIAGIKEG